MHLVEQLRPYKNDVNYTISSSKVRLENAIKANERLEGLQVKLLGLEGLKRKLDEYQIAIKSINKAAVDVRKVYETERIDFINEITTANVSRIFPEERFKITILAKSLKTYMMVTNGEGHTLSTDLGCGMLLQYLLGYSATSAILEAMEMKTILLDEAFSVSSKENLVELSSILDEQSREGFLIIMISQDPLLYNNIPRREFILSKGYNGVSVSSVNDVWRE